MGFSVEASSLALKKAKNILALAIEFLINNGAMEGDEGEQQRSRQEIPTVAPIVAPVFQKRVFSYEASESSNNVDQPVVHTPKPPSDLPPTNVLDFRQPTTADAVAEALDLIDVRNGQLDRGKPETNSNKPVVTVVSRLDGSGAPLLVIAPKNEQKLEKFDAPLLSVTPKQDQQKYNAPLLSASQIQQQQQQKPVSANAAPVRIVSSQGGAPLLAVAMPQVAQQAPQRQQLAQNVFPIAQNGQVVYQQQQPQQMMYNPQQQQQQFQQQLQYQQPQQQYVYNQQGPPPQLMTGWEERKDPRSGRPYYVNHVSQTTSWVHPGFR